MDLTPLWEWFRELNATTGIKLTIFYDAFDRARFVNGFLTSVRLMTLCIVASVALGVVGAWVQGSRLRLVRVITRVYRILPQHAAAGAALFLLLRARLLSAHHQRRRPRGADRIELHLGGDLPLALCRCFQHRDFSRRHRSSTER